MRHEIIKRVILDLLISQKKAGIRLYPTLEEEKGQKGGVRKLFKSFIGMSGN